MADMDDEVSLHPGAREAREAALLVDMKRALRVPGLRPTDPVELWRTETFIVMLEHFRRKLGQEKSRADAS
jgi:hypothetical protein